MKKKAESHRLGGNGLVTASPFLIPSLIGFAIFYTDLYFCTEIL